MAVNISDEQLKALARNANVTYQNSSRGIIEEEEIQYPSYAELDHSDLSLKGLSMRISSLKSVAKTGNFEDLLFPGNEGFKLKLNTATYLATNGEGRKDNAEHGFMSGEDKYTFDDFFKGNIEHRHELVHRTDPGHKHIPAGGSAGQVLMYKADGEAQWKNHTIYSAGQGITIKGIGEKDPKDCEVLLNFTKNDDEAKNSKDPSDVNGSNIGSSVIVPRADHVHDGRYLPASGSTTFNVSSKLKFTAASNISFDNNVALRGTFADSSQYKMVSIDDFDRLVFGDTAKGAIAINAKNIDSGHGISYYKKGTEYYMVTAENIADQHVASAKKLTNGVTINGTKIYGDETDVIYTARWGTARNITITSNDGSNPTANNNIDGRDDFTLKLPATITANLNGTSAKANKLTNGVTINGTKIYGNETNDISTARWGTARIFRISDGNNHTGEDKSVNGGEGDVVLKLPTTIKATLEGNADSATTSSKIKIDGIDRTVTVEGHTLKFK